MEIVFSSIGKRRHTWRIRVIKSYDGCRNFLFFSEKKENFLLRQVKKKLVLGNKFWNFFLFKSAIWNFENNIQIEVESAKLLQTKWKWSKLDVSFFIVVYLYRDFFQSI